ncbi:RNA polymerase factor sigma-54 [Parvicella tangerina]|uniref:RNA polymerase sigma-54 factor n=1 Tax=Parvicella tangerina TaxID=2829795 RepID=A0A916NP89_9FLAO|nr:RNA polymerase factor sigma-54 [Parvicella tangerina]CAG5076278.1 RNA polymerase sigma-54 factor [Parvicella tangerina]
MALRQSLQHKLLQKLSPQQIQLMKLLQVPTVELEQRIKQEIEDNPALEEGAEEIDRDLDREEEDWENDVDDSREDFDVSDYLDDDTPDYKLSVRNHGADNDEKAIPLSGGQSFQDLLISQIGLRVRDEKMREIAKTIIGNLDESGYLRREIENMIDDLAFSQNIMVTEEELLEGLEIVQDLEPAGVGARDLKECLLLQLERKAPTVTIRTAQAILEKCFDEFTKKHYKKILKKLEIEEDDLRTAINEIVKLNPKPGGAALQSNKTMQQIIPDFIIREEDGQLELTLNARNAPRLKVSKEYAEMLRAYGDSKKTKSDKDAVMFVKQKIDAAKWFIDAIRQRQHTLLITMDAIMNYQKEFFLTGDETNIRPMILKDIADIVEMDISTVSRVANSKYVETPYGIFLLKYFFSESLSTESGEEVSTREVKKILQEAVDNEDKKKPLTDEKLMNHLKDKGYNIARRTVAKYREQLGIPVARLRKEI